MNKEQLAWVASKIQQCQHNRLYGELVIKFESGKIVHVSEKKTYKPPSKKE